MTWYALMMSSAVDHNAPSQQQQVGLPDDSASSDFSLRSTRSRREQLRFAVDS
jgi:hypothetical protein